MMDTKQFLWGVLIKIRLSCSLMLEFVVSEEISGLLDGLDSTIGQDV